MHFCAGWINSDFFSTVPMSFFKLYFSTVILSGGGLLRSTIVSRGGRSPPQLITRVQGIVRWCDGGDAWENAVLSFLFLLLLLSLGCMKSLKWHQAVRKRVYRVLLSISYFQILHLFVMVTWRLPSPHWSLFYILEEQLEWKSSLKMVWYQLIYNFSST